MAAIDTYLQQIRTAVYGRDVRSAIASGIEECYAYVSAYEGLDTTSFATKSDLDNYLTKTIASQTYATTDSLGSYVTQESADNAYATKTELESYITSTAADGKYATKTQLENYLTSDVADETYVKIDDLESGIAASDLQLYLTKTEAEQTYIPLADSTSFATKTDLNNYGTLEYVDSTFARQEYFIDFHSFDIVVCPGNPILIPKDAVHDEGDVGTMNPSADTMHKIYLVKHASAADVQYDKYITVQNADETYSWERFAGEVSSGGSGSGGGSLEGIDLNDYVLWSDADQKYATIESLTQFLGKESAEQLYVSRTDLEDSLTTLLNNQDYATRNELRAYMTRDEADNVYATQQMLGGYAKALDVQNLYATKAYVDEYIITYPSGENLLMLLEVDNVPGTTQTIYYKSNGDIDRIVHVKDGTNVRVDSFVFGDESITETRTLSGGQKLTMVTNTETSETVTTYTANN